MDPEGADDAADIDPGIESVGLAPIGTADTAPPLGPRRAQLACRGNPTATAAVLIETLRRL